MFTERGTGYRPYLDGLRAIAVAGVIVYHLNEAWLPGGFLGVDLFFVLSGYLITTLLVNEHARTGRIDLPAFWARRVRRLLPALLVVLVAVAVGVRLAGDEVAAASARGDLLATLLYFANWHFIWSDQSYFAQFAAPSPVRHAWSLAIEEQFYLAWPLVVGLVLTRVGRRGLLATIMAIGAASAVALWLLHGSAADPSRAYYGTDARAYQLLVGAALAVGLAGRARGAIVRWARPLSIPALLAVAAMMLALTDADPVYYRGGGLAFAVTAAVLIAGLEGGSRLARPLSLRPMVATGLVSYGLYLWHWPVMLAVGAVVGPTVGPLPALLAVLVTGLLAATSYLVVERPIRRDARLWRWELRPRRLALAVPAASMMVALVVVLGTGQGRAPDWAGQVPKVAVREVAPNADAAAPVIGLVGDSVLRSAVGSLEVEGQARGWRMVDATLAGCPVGYEPLYNDQGVISSFDERCRGVRAAHDRMLAADPEIVIWHDLQSVLARRGDGGELLLAGTTAWANDLLAEWESVLARFRASGAQVVIILPPLRSQDPPGCAGAVNTERCAEVQRQDTVMRAVSEALWERVADRGGVHLVELDRVLCPEGYPCPATLDGVTVRPGPWDQTHFSEAGADWVVPRLLDLVEAATGRPAPKAESRS